MTFALTPTTTPFYSDSGPPGPTYLPILVPITINQLYINTDNNDLYMCTDASDQDHLEWTLIPRADQLIENIHYTNFDTAPSDSQSSSLSLGTAYQNTFGYDVVLTVYLNITSALTANILLGVASTNTPTQQTIISGLTLIALGVVPVSIYLPSNYYALLSTSGTISVSISGQIAMPV